MARTPNLDDLAALRSVSDVRVAPGGEQVAYVVTEPDPVTSTIWIDDRPVAEGRLPRWLPDGSLAFVRDAELRVLPPAMGDSRVHLTMETPIVEHAWSPDGTSVATTTIVDSLEADAPIVIDRLLFKLDGFGRLTGRAIELFVDGEQRTTTGGLVSNLSWTPDGAHILFSASLHLDRDLDGATDVFRVAAAGGAIERLTTWTGVAGAPVIDGDRIVFVGLSESNPMLINRIWVCDDKPTELLPDLDRNVLVGGTGYPGAPLQSDGRGGLLFVLREHGYAPLVRWHEGELRTLVAGVVTSASVDCESGVVAAVVTTDDRPEEVVVTDLDGAEPRRITSLHDDLVAAWELGTLEERWFEAPDGTRLQGWLRTGTGDGPRPLFVDIHGGPHNAWSPVFDGAHLNHHVLAERGWAILTLNPRASDGYGQDFWAGTGGDWGIADEGDFHAAIDALVAEGIADPDRISVGGYSYGGYMTAWLVGRSDRFRSAIAGGVVSGTDSMHGASDVAGLSLWREWRGRPWEDPDGYRERSPLTYVDRVTTPTLLLHGAEDTRCPVGEAERFFTALRARGVPTQLVLYPGAAHVYPIAGPLAHRRDHQQRVIDWLVEHGEGDSEHAS